MRVRCTVKSIIRPLLSSEIVSGGLLDYIVWVIPLLLLVGILRLTVDFLFTGMARSDPLDRLPAKVVNKRAPYTLYFDSHNLQALLL